MKLRRVLLAVLAALLAVAVAPPLSAYAGGPTSVLLVNPDSQLATAAYHDDAVYEELSSAVGDGGSGPTDPPASIGADWAASVRLTWLIHDVSIWRIDQIHLTKTDGIWVETLLDPHPSAPGSRGRWHRPADAEMLTAALTTAGLLGDSGVAPTSPSGMQPAATVPASATPLPGLLLAGLGGMVLGAAGPLVAIRARARRPSERPARVTLSG